MAFLKAFVKKEIVYQNIFKNPWIPRGTAKATATFKEITNCKIPQAAGVIDDVHKIILDPNACCKLDYYYRK